MLHYGNVGKDTPARAAPLVAVSLADEEAVASVQEVQDMGSGEGEEDVVQNRAHW
jgi:hypothetical protein